MYYFSGPGENGHFKSMQEFGEKRNVIILAELQLAFAIIEPFIKMFSHFGS
jgi:hypothetical protein